MSLDGIAESKSADGSSHVGDLPLGPQQSGFGLHALLDVATIPAMSMKVTRPPRHSNMSSSVKTGRLTGVR